MANVQGMCKNCGSLIMFDDRNAECECLFCNCIFPSSEAIEVFNNPEGITFPNEKYEPSNSITHQYTTRVFSSENIDKAVIRQELSKSKDDDSSITTNEYEISPKDIKAPKRIILTCAACILGLIAITLIIALPSYTNRKKIELHVANGISSCFDGICAVDLTKDGQGNVIGYSVYGQNSQNLIVYTDDSISEEDASSIRDKYISLRASVVSEGKKNGKDVVVTIFAQDGRYIADSQSVSFVENEIPAPAEKSGKKDK